MEEGARMTFNLIGNRIISPLSKVVCSLVVLFFSSNALADYYVVYPDMEVVAPPPCVVCQPKPKPCAVKHHKKIHKHHYRCAKVYKKKSTAVVSVYYIYNNNCGQPCSSGCNPYVRMQVDRGCGTVVYSGGTAVRHSDSYYMQGCDDDGYCDPDMDGNTLDNDIYY